MASSGGVFSSHVEVQKWHDAVQLYDNGEFSAAIDKFKEVLPCAKMLFDIACCYLSTNKMDLALKNYEETIQMDSHMAVSYFMIGLIYYSKNNFDDSFKYFEKARTALRGNKYIDYSQLGLHYKLYACEIKTNQAHVLVKQNNIGKAKELLLLAITCKTEKRHDIISDSLNMLQAGAGCAMSLFILPQHLIFRPSRKIINELKKKDYLGKSQVVVADNSEDMYSCFSGLKARKDGEIPSHVREEDVKAMLTDLKIISDKKEKLKRTPPQKQLPVLNTENVIDTFPRTAPRPSHKPSPNQSPNSKRWLSNGAHPPRRPPLPAGPPSRNSLVETPDVNIQKNDVRVIQAPPRPPPVNMANINRTPSCGIRPKSCSVPSKPPLVAPKTRHHINNNGYHNGDNNNNNNDNNCQSKSPSKKVHEVELCYTFTHKVRLKEGLSLSEVLNIVEAQVLPDDIYMCIKDEHGRNQPLTQRTLEKLFESNSIKKEIFCSTSPYNDNYNAPT